MIESVDLESDGRGGEQLVAWVRLKGEVASRCSRCQRRRPGYDLGMQPRRWRGLDLGTTPVFLQATSRRVSCPEHGGGGRCGAVGPAGSGFSAAFEDRRVAGLPRHAVGGDGALVVTCHDTGRLVWARVGSLRRGSGEPRRGGVSVWTCTPGFRQVLRLVGWLGWGQAHAPGAVRRSPSDHLHCHAPHSPLRNQYRNLSANSRIGRDHVALLPGARSTVAVLIRLTPGK